MMDRAAPHTAAPAPAAAPRCLSCGATRTGPFCAVCGQRSSVGRLSVGGVLRRAVGAALDLDRGFLHTLLALLRRPGHAAREYVQGRTAPYTNPIKYFLALVTFAQVVSIRTGRVEDLAAGLTEGYADAARDGAQKIALPELARVSAFLGDYFVVLAALALPVLAGLLRLAFRNSGYNYAECLVFGLFVYAQGFLLLGLLGLIPTGPVEYLLALLGLAAGFGYFAWAAAQFFDTPPARTLRRAALVALGALLTLVLGAALALALVARA